MAINQDIATALLGSDFATNEATYYFLKSVQVSIQIIIYLIRMFKEFEHNEKTVIVDQHRQQQEYKLLHRQKMHPGHTLFELDMQNDTLQPCTYQDIQIGVDMHGNPVHERRVNMKQHCVYIPALNIKSAKKKLRKILTELKTKNNK